LGLSCRPSLASRTWTSDEESVLAPDRQLNVRGRAVRERAASSQESCRFDLRSSGQGSSAVDTVSIQCRSSHRKHGVNQSGKWARSGSRMERCM
jgi:hypothetical protein